MIRATFCVLLLGCASANTSTGGTCHRADRDQLYLITAQELSGGTCGPTATQLAIPKWGYTPECHLDAPDAWVGDCKVTQKFSCKVLFAGVENIVQTAAITTEDPTTHRITGTLSLVDNGADGYACRSTYQISADPQ